MAATNKKFRIRSGDTVVVISGKQKGHTGRVVKVLPAKDAVVVEGVRVVTRHQKPVGDRPGGKIEKEGGRQHHRRENLPTKRNTTMVGCAAPIRPFACGAAWAKCEGKAKANP